ncbi:3-deoxy-8-phosphooctulonate synthase [bacterium]|jgi:2-dehydro-3-deoxyphosphooctonate aldolase (KDO 8-P synthase)|nr:3-deoxy-8-phosphooctulonate synthase [bacterium]
MLHTSVPPMTLIAGPCVIEDEGLLMEIASELKRQLHGLPIQLFFKASFDKANRSSIDGFRGPGMTEGLRILTRVKEKTGLPLLTDIHTVEQAEEVAKHIDFLQVPAFLCRQTDLIVAVTEAALKWNRKVNVKKGQFLAPWDTKNIVEKVRAVEAGRGGSHKKLDLYLTERGASFGYNTLVVDMTSFQTMSRFGVTTIYDATHSIQSPGGGPGGRSTGGKREYLEVLARAAFAAGADGLFMECHPRPDMAKSDGPNSFYLEHVGTFIQQILEFRRLAQTFPKLLPEANR